MILLCALQVVHETVTLLLDLQPIKLTPADSFRHYRMLYVRYLQIYQKLERVYEGTVHPQKRIDARNVIETVLSRLVQLHHLLVKWHPPNPGVAAATPGKPFPWEYVDLDDEILERKLQVSLARGRRVAVVPIARVPAPSVQPEVLEIPPPRFFIDDRLAGGAW